MMLMEISKYLDLSDDDDDDIYIIMKCPFVTNISTSSLESPVTTCFFMVFHGSRSFFLIYQGSRSVFYGSRWVFMVIQGSRSVFMILGRFLWCQVSLHPS